MNIYKKLNTGHLFQSIKTGPMPDYSEQYSKTRYDTYSTTDKMSELRYEIIKKHIGNVNSVFDFGYGNGSFLKYCYDLGIDCYGYDISDYPLKSGIQVVQDPDSVEVDVMTFFDSIEHLDMPNLHEFLQSKKTKYFVISVPWYHESCGDDWFMNWKHRRENEHFHHFDSSGLISLLTDINCKIIHVGNDEDKIRTPYSNLPNILTVVAKV